MKFEHLVSAIAHDTANYLTSYPDEWEEGKTVRECIRARLDRLNRDGFTVHTRGSMGSDLVTEGVYLSESDLEVCVTEVERLIALEDARA